MRPDRALTSTGGGAMPPPARPLLVEMRATLALSTPLAGVFLLTIGINTGDVVLLAQAGPEALAAGSLGMNLFWLLFMFALGPMLAIGPLAARARGGRQPRRLRRILRQGLWVAAVLGVPLAALLALGEPLLALLGQEPRLAAGGGAYLDWRLWGFVPGLIVAGLRAFLSALDRAGVVLWTLAIGTLVNLPLTWALIFGQLGLPAMGVAGAGAASALVELGMAAALLLYVARARGLRRRAFLARLWRTDWPLFLEILRVGVPLGLIRVMEAGLFSAATFMLGALRPADLAAAQLAAHSIALQYAAIAFMIPVGISQAGAVRVGQWAGAGDLPGVRRAMLAGLAIGWLYLLVSSALLVGLAGFWAGLLLDPAAAADVLPLATLLIMMAGAFQLVDGTQTIAAGLLSGLKDTRGPMLIAALGYWGVGLPVAWALGLPGGLNAAGIWIGLSLALAVVAVLLLLRCWQALRRGLPD